MTDPTPTPDDNDDSAPPASDPLTGDAPAPDDPDSEDQNSAAAKASADAKKYRLRLRETEEERDTLASQLDEYRRRDVEAVAGEVLADGADLWTSVTELAEFIDDNGALDTDAVATAARAIVKGRPHWGKPGPTGDRDQGLKGGDQTPPPASFGDVLRRATGQD